MANAKIYKVSLQR
ncbi:hypothetical protein, partial [Klebsiella phage vB_KpnM_TU02]